MGTRLTREEALEALEVMDVAVIIADIINDGSWVTWVNPAFTRVFGYTLEEMLDGALARIMGPRTDMDEIDRMYQEVRRGRRSTITTLGYCADGTEFWSTFTMAPVEVHGRVVRWVGIQHDVSEHVLRSQRDRRSYELERRARIGLSVVGVVSDVLAETENPRVLRTAADVLQSRLVSWAGFFVEQDGELRELDGADGGGGSPRRRSTRPRALLADADPVRAVLAATDLVRGFVDLDVAQPPGTPAAAIAARARPHRAARPGSADQVILVPVVGRRATLCVLAALPRTTDVQEGESGGEIATILELVARRVGLALENARLYRDEHAVAETLQRAMLPEQAHTAGLDVWTYYAPNVEHAQVGGDWYDVVPLVDGTVGVVVGDVAGHDVEAAAAMGQLRSVVRAYAHELVDPGTVLSRVDVLVAGMRIPRAASLVYATLTPTGQGWDVAYSRAGHLPPLLVRDGAVTALDEAGGILVGFGEQQRSTATCTARAGDVLVFYTDGLVERRDRALRDGVAALRAICARLGSADAAGVGEQLLDQLADAPEDDVAVVVVRIPDPQEEGRPESGAAPRRRRWQLAPDPLSIGRARHAVVTTCAAWGAAESAGPELVVSELVANAVTHGWGPVGLFLEDTPDGLRIEVTDLNPDPPRVIEEGGDRDRLGGYGLHIVARLGTWGWAPLGEGKVVWAVVPPGAADRSGGRRWVRPAPRLGR